MRIKNSILFIALVLILSLSCYAQKKDMMNLSINVTLKNLSFGEYIPAKISTTNAKQQNFKIKYRGNSSAGYDKKSFSIKFQEKVAFKQLDSSYKWKLNADYIDKTLMRNKLSYDLFKAFSEKNISPKTTYVLLKLNGSPQGIYVLTQRVDENLLQLNKNDSSTRIFKAPPISIPTEKHNQKHKDYLGFSQWNPFYEDFSEKAKEKLIKQAYYNQRYPKIRESDKKKDVHEITEFIFSSSDNDFSNPEIFNSFFDIESLIDWHLLLLVTNNADGLIKNFYIYKQNKSEPYKICPWDYDHSFGRDGGGYLDLTSFIDISQNKLLDRLIKTDAFNYKKKLYDKFLSLKKEKVLTYSTINKMIKKNISLIKPHIKQNDKIWPLNNMLQFEESNFKKEIALIKFWIKNRLPQVEKYLLQLNAPVNH
tara:strand:+ start:322 stop:1587 length:1266 start_codon:yes stop_codon:yes gene_type:complete